RHHLLLVIASGGLGAQQIGDAVESLLHHHVGFLVFQQGFRDEPCIDANRPHDADLRSASLMSVPRRVWMAFASSLSFSWESGVDKRGYSLNVSSGYT